MNINEIIFMYDHWMKELFKMNHGGYKNWQQWWFDDVFVLKYVHYVVFYDFTSFL